MDFQYQISSEFEVREGIVDLYLNVKIRSSDEVIFNVPNNFSLDLELQ